MQSARLSSSRYHRRRRSSTRDLDDDLQELSICSSRPSTQDSKRTSYSRLSTDSGEGSLEDFSRRSYSPAFLGDAFGPGRRHTAPTRKPTSPTHDDEGRPNTVHAWDAISSRCSLSRYPPLPAIGSQQQRLGQYDPDRPVPVRKQCFVGDLDVDVAHAKADRAASTGSDDDERLTVRVFDKSSSTEGKDDDVKDRESPVARPVFSLTVDSDVDSDFEDESGIATQGESDVEDVDSKPRRPIIRSATFTIEKERPDVHGPFLEIAVRLPTGDRVAKCFDCKETLQSVCDFAVQNAPEQSAARWTLVTTDFPKRIFKDLTMTLKEADVDDKSLLYLQTWDDSDSD